MVYGGRTYGEGIYGVPATYMPDGVTILPIPEWEYSIGDRLYGDRSTTYRWEVLVHIDGSDHLIGVLDGVVDSSASLTWSLYAAVKGAGTLQVNDLDEAAPGMLRIGELHLESVRLRPVCIIEGLDEIPLSVFLVSAAVEHWTETGRVWDIELLDRCTVPDQDLIEESYQVPAGTSILGAVQTVLAAAGEHIDVDESETATTAASMVWEAGTSKLKICNDLLAAAGYSALWVDGYGLLRATRYQVPADRSITYEVLGLPRELIDGEQSIYEPTWSRDRDSYSVPNKVIAVQAAGGEDEEALTGTWTNEDPDSPYSFQARGRWITHVLDGVECPDGTPEEIEAFLEQKARASLIAASAVQAEVTVRHLPIPIRVSEVLRFAHTQAGIDAPHVVTRIELEAHPLGLMRSQLQEVLSL